MNTLIRFIIILMLNLVFIMPGILSYGQTAQDSNKTIYKESFDVVREYMPKLTDALKLDVIPVNERIEVKKPEITYVSKATLVKVDATKSEKIPPVVLIKTERKPLDRFYVKAGYGNYNNILAEAYYNSIKPKDKSLTAHALYHSGKSGLKYSNAFQAAGDITGRYDFRGKTLSGKVFLDNNRYQYYGFNPSDTNIWDTLKPENHRQNYLLTGFNASFANELDKSSKFKYQVDAGLYHFLDAQKVGELGINIHAKLEQYFNNSPIRFEAGFHHFIINSDPTLHRNVFDIKASYLLNLEKFKAEIGFNAPTETDSIETKAHFYPNLKIEGQLIESYLYGFAGMTGGLMINNYRSIAYENPYIVSNFELRNSNNKMELYAGFKGNIVEKIGYKVNYSFHILENLLLFVNDNTEQEKFQVIYDSSNTILHNIHGEMLFNILPDLSLFAGTNYFLYDQNPPEPYPWHLPIFDLTVSAKYSIQNKILLTLDYFMIGKRYARDVLDPATPIEMKPIHDLNLGATYKFNDKFAAFFNFNNILNSKYSYWNHYELRGFHFMAGLKGNF